MFTILFGPFAVMIAVPLTIVAMEAIEIFDVEAIIGEAG